jgi:hypothetical protein
METEYKQDITINDMDYVAFLISNSDNLPKESESGDKKNMVSFKFVISGNGNEYVLQIKSESKKIMRLQHALRNKMSLSYKTSLTKEGDLVLKLHHQLIDLDDGYILKKQDHDTSIGALLENRIKHLEKKCLEDEYPITDDMIGPCYKTQCDITAENIQKVIDNVAQEPVKTTVIKGINNYYHTKYVYQKEVPVPSKNQLVYCGLLLFNENSLNHKKDVSNMYTILTKKYSNNVSAIMTKKDNTITFNMCGQNSGNLECDFKRCPSLKSEYINSQNIVFCDEDAYYKYCYLAEIPFHVDDGLYRMGESSFILVKNKKIYMDIINCKNDKFTINSYGPKSFTFKLNK